MISPFYNLLEGYLWAVCRGTMVVANINIICDDPIC